jgi:adenylyltransferase/sulfurtransferase
MLSTLRLTRRYPHVNIHDVGDRYSRQVLFQGIGKEGQERLRTSRVLLVGCGALGTVIAEILVRAGVGQLSVVDRDFIDESNLQRQSLFTEADWRASLPKAVAAAHHLREINSQVEIRGSVADVRATTVESLVDSQDLILDGTDNFETRFLLNDVSVKYSVPWVYGACVGSYGICLPVLPGETPCLRCLIELLPPPGSSPTCDTAGILGPIVHVVAAFEAAEALKILTGNLKKVSRRLINIDVWDNRMSHLDLASQGRNPGCPACGKRDFEFLRGDHEDRSAVLCGRNAVQIWREKSQPADLSAIAERLAASGNVTLNDYLLRAVVDGFEFTLFKDGRAIIRGTQDVEMARGLYSSYVGN